MRTVSVLIAVGLILAVAGLMLTVAGTAGATTVWGTSHASSGYWQGGSIWTVETTTGALSVKQTYAPTELLAFGDIAVNMAGEVYVTYYGQDGFDKLAKVNTTTWGFDWVQDLGGWNDQVNALEFIGADLYGVTGGGIDADVLKFTLTGSGATVSNLGKIGINSDGDLSRDPLTGTVYYTSWETANGTQLNTLDLAAPSETFVAYTTGNGWSGLAFDEDGVLWAGNYNENKLYTMNTATGAAAFEYNLPDVGPVTGLSTAVPEPMTMAGLALGIGSLATYLRRRKA